MRTPSSSITVLVAAFAVAAAVDYSSTTCTPAGQRCAGATGKPFVKFNPCCDSSLACIEKESPTADEWGSYCLKPATFAVCYNTGERCMGASGHLFVQYLGCCNPADECVSDASMGWGSFCKGSDAQTAGSTSATTKTILSATITSNATPRTTLLETTATIVSITTPSTASTPESGSPFIQQILAVHNKYRAAVGSPALTWSATLANDALQWANHLKNSKTLSLIHSGVSGEGENLWGGTANAFTYTQMAQSWADESANFESPAFTSIAGTGGNVIGHYTQMVWKATTQIGCAVATGNGNDYLVCRYAPQGNVIGQNVY